jgi:hypothetical protein
MAVTGSSWWDRYGNVSQIASTVIALIGFGAILLQIQEIRNNNRATAARQVYQAHVDLDFRNPQFANPDLAKIKAAGGDTLTQYRSFVSSLLYACSEVLAAFPDDSTWHHSCQYEIKSHLPFLCEAQSRDSKYLEMFGKNAIDFVKSEMTRQGVTAPQCQLKAA